MLANDCVNALRRATLISTLQNKKFRLLGLACQCPKTGNSHFHEKNKSAVISELCQCPKTGNSHFHDSFNLYNHNRRLCQCPKTGNSHFHVCATNLSVQWELCQCPKTGNSHFHINQRPANTSNTCVNALRRATLISTEKRNVFLREQQCVNALRRATLISTLAHMGTFTFLCNVSMP